MNSEFAPIAQRIVNAQNNFVANVQNIATCTKAEAEKVLTVYRKAKVLKNDFVNGSIIHVWRADRQFTRITDNG